MFIQTWFLPFSLLATATVVAFPLSRYLAWIMDGKYRPWLILGWFEKRLDSGPQTWGQYTSSLLVFNAVLFVFGFLILALQPWMPLNPDAKTLLAPSTIFHSVVSFMTNTDLQHYAGDQHLSNFSQIFFGITNLFVSAAVGLSALTAIIRALRGDAFLGNYFVDMWRVLAYLFVPIAFVIALIFIQQGSPMTFESSYQVATLEPAAMGVNDNGQAKPQTIVVGPVAAFEAIKMLGTNGGGFYGMNSAHPFENPTALSNFFNTLALLIHPLMILMPTGLFSATDWGLQAVSNPGAHGFSQMLYQFSSASANNGSAFDGLGVTYGFYNNPTPSPTAVAWDIATGIVIVISRYLPIIAPIAMAAYLGKKKSSPFGLGTLRDDTPTFGILLLSTILIVGALLFLPVAVLGPVAEHLGPIPFGG